MFDSITGTLVCKDAAGVVVSAGGLGYRLGIPQRIQDNLPENGEITLYTHLAVKDDSLKLYGFPTPRERDLFLKIMSVSGIGAATALNLLSQIPPQEFLRAVAGRESFRERCTACYRMRLEKTARLALAEGFDAITTTLLISPHQDQQQIRSIGEEVAGMLGVEFLFENLRRGWAERGRLTREHGLYRQQYCGCIYSEWERYHDAQIDVLLGTSEGLDRQCTNLGGRS